MPASFKIKISDIESLREKLLSLGAHLVREIQITDVYFNQSKGKVLKLRSNSAGENYLVSFGREEKNNILTYPNEIVEDREKLLQDLSLKYGIQVILDKEVEFYQYESLQVSFHKFKEFGDYFVIEGDNQLALKIIEKLSLSPHESLTMSFPEYFGFK